MGRGGKEIGDWIQGAAESDPASCLGSAGAAVGRGGFMEGVLHERAGNFPDAAFGGVLGGAACFPWLADRDQMLGRNESLIEKAQDRVGESGGMAVAIFPVGEHFLTALEQGGELLLRKLQSLAHGLDVRACQ